MKLIFTKGPSLHARFLYALVFALFIMFADTHFSSFFRFRTYVETLISPIYYIVNIPKFVLDQTTQSLTSYQQLQEENGALNAKLASLKSDLLLLEQLKQENSHLHQLLGSPLRKDELKMVTQVISAQFGPYSDQLVINKGSKDGVYDGQPIIDDKGVVGQVFSVGEMSSRVILLCDPLHGIPVKSLRNDTRGVAMGNGCSQPLQLEFFPTGADFQVGDVLVTSGLDGRFPEGYPVATVSSVKDDAQQGRLIINLKATADLDKLRYLLLLWKDKSLMAPQAVRKAVIIQQSS